MKTLMLWLLVALSLGVTTVEEVVTSTDTFAICKAADIATTAYIIEHGIGVESNPVVAATLAHGYMPIIAISIGLWWLLKEYNNPTATAGANVVTCGVAVHNLLLIP